MKNNFKISVSMLLAAIIFWASAFAGIRAALQNFSPESIALGRFLVASLIFAAVATARGIRIPRGKDLLITIFFGGLLNITVYHFFLNIGEKTVVSGVASVIVSLSPIIIALTARLILGERLKNIQRLGIAVSFAGVVVLSGGGYAFDRGIILILIATIASSCYTVAQKQLLTKYRAIDLTTCTIWFGTFFLLPCAPKLYAELSVNTVTAFLPILWLGIFPSALSYTMWAYALKRFTANQCASTLYLSPVLAFIIGWVWLDEMPTSTNVAGGIVILLGIALVNGNLQKNFSRLFTRRQ